MGQLISSNKGVTFTMTRVVIFGLYEDLLELLVVSNFKWEGTIIVKIKIVHVTKEQIFGICFLYI